MSGQGTRTDGGQETQAVTIWHLRKIALSAPRPTAGGADDRHKIKTPLVYCANRGSDGAVRGRYRDVSGSDEEV
jgi:hypothetical protein